MALQVASRYDVRFVISLVFVACDKKGGGNDCLRRSFWFLLQLSKNSSIFEAYFTLYVKTFRVGWNIFWPANLCFHLI